MPVFKTAGVDAADVQVVTLLEGHDSIGWVIYDSAKKNGLEMVISGEGTHFHGFADKVIGLKRRHCTRCRRRVVSPARARTYFCSATRLSFTQDLRMANADMVFGGETRTVAGNF